MHSHEELKSLVQDASKNISAVVESAEKIVLGQNEMIRTLVMALVTDGHVLLEGVPGLAKTLAVRVLGKLVDAEFRRVQFTPDLMPSDVLGTTIFDEKKRDFEVKKGPIFTNLLLADEINRAPAKVQSALLEAMAEKQVTLGETTYELPKPFLVLATQNPIENTGTYELPEAQLDRFMFKVCLQYPTRNAERALLDDDPHEKLKNAKSVLSLTKIFELQKLSTQIHMDDRVKEYIVRIVQVTRPDSILDNSEVDAQKLFGIRKKIFVGASPRATLALARASKAEALFQGRAFVTPEDVKAVSHAVLRHRMILGFDSEASGLEADSMIQEILNCVNIP